MSNDNQLTRETVADDAVWGVAAIAREIGRSTPQTYYLISRGVIPVARLGHRTIIASRRQLRKLIATES
jgi:hypothetical protein